MNLLSEDPKKRPESVVDVGCGIGGSSRYLARKFEAECQGITLSPVQAQRANSLAAAQGLADKVNMILVIFTMYINIFIYIFYILVKVIIE